MDLKVFFSLLLLIPFFYLYLKHIFSKSPPLPPGPFAWPIVGNFFQMGRQLHYILANLARIHGPLMSLRFGKQITIIASSPDAAREVLKTHDRDLSGRYITNALPLINPKLNFAFGFSPECNDYWRGLRVICKTDLFSAKVLESQNHIREKKVSELVGFLGSKEGEVVNLGETVFVTFTNFLSNAIFSVDFLNSVGKGIGKEFRKLIVEIVELGMIPDLSDFYPILSGMDFQGIQKKRDEIVKNFITIWDDIIKERRKQESSIFGQRDFLDALIKEGFTNDQISQLILDLLLAGTDSSSMVTEWAMAELMRNQDVLHKLRDELKREIGTEMVKESHLAHLPYLEACVKETLRLYPPGPLLIPHRALQTCQVMGYTIPKDSKILVNMWAIGRDPSIFNDPLRFKPERFLDSTLDFKGTNFAYTPFGAGRRVCPGQPLATKQVPLILASLVHSFDWFLPGGMKSTELDMNDHFAITLKKKQPLQLIPIGRK
ncbi:probable (S)-N-methylcoclaurine 3'-hydroxylase isozyme 2 [Quercus robur]|uniref:probable (S)-N-methylcoclaurine 3'-hydroxylase isozyme 2 n=1 Tax=Quercus robur TaxID=38942 RepID=UPI0021627D72|nr:probable (S)-N-methylcoclaurine 3'-hydroxylase isozyme 2 [Quercus robur]